MNPQTENATIVSIPDVICMNGFWKNLMMINILEQYLFFTDIISTRIVIQIYYLPSRSILPRTLYSIHTLPLSGETLRASVAARDCIVTELYWVVVLHWETTLWPKLPNFLPNILCLYLKLESFIKLSSVLWHCHV